MSGTICTPNSGATACNARPTCPPAPVTAIRIAQSPPCCDCHARWREQASAGETGGIEIVLPRHVAGEVTLAHRPPRHHPRHRPERPVRHMAHEMLKADKYAHARPVPRHEPPCTLARQRDTSTPPDASRRRVARRHRRPASRSGCPRPSAAGNDQQRRRAARHSRACRAVAATGASRPRVQECANRPACRGGAERRARDRAIPSRYRTRPRPTRLSSP